MTDAPLVEAVLAQPKDQQLSYALGLIRTLTQPSPGMAAHLRRTIRATPKEIAVFAVLLRREGSPVPKAAIYESVWGEWSEVDPKIVDVLVSKLRAKLPEGARIETHWGLGYSAAAGTSAALGLGTAAACEPGATEPLGPSTARLGRAREPWDSADDETLGLMADNGSELWAMAEELERSERAVRDRLKIIRPDFKIT